MCSPCDDTIQIVREVTGLKIQTLGTHGKTYRGWVPPSGRILEIIMPQLTKLTQERAREARRISETAKSSAATAVAAATDAGDGWTKVLGPAKIREIKSAASAAALIGESNGVMLRDEPSILSLESVLDFGASLEASAKATSMRAGFTAYAASGKGGGAGATHSGAGVDSATGRGGGRA